LTELPKEGNEASDQGNIAEFLDREDFRATEINNAARNCYVGTEVSNFNYLVRQSSVRAGNDESFHFANRQFHPSLTSYNLHRMPPDVLQRPEKSLADELIKAYFDEINRGWPIIDEEDFMVKYGGQDPHNPMPPQLLNAVFLVGAHVLATHDKSMKARQAEFFRRAKTIIDFRFEQDRISHIQAAVLLSWYSDGQEEIMANAWHWIGVACRIGLGMGLHRDTTPSRLVQVSKRTWTRLWWVLFQLDTMIASAYGRPQAL
jgi:transcriptional regulatory protein AMDR